MASPTCCKSIHAPGRWNLRRHKACKEYVLQPSLV